MSALIPNERGERERLYLIHPGSLIATDECEIARVTRQRKNAMPLVHAVISAKGGPYMGWLKRDTLESGFALKGGVVPNMLPALNLDALRGYAHT